MTPSPRQRRVRARALCYGSRLPPFLWWCPSPLRAALGEYTWGLHGTVPSSMCEGEREREKREEREERTMDCFCASVLVATFVCQPQAGTPMQLPGWYIVTTPPGLEFRICLSRLPVNSSHTNKTTLQQNNGGLFGGSFPGPSCRPRQDRQNSDAFHLRTLHEGHSGLL